MNDFLEKMAELLEEDKVNPEDQLNGFDAWDSLTVLSIIAYADEDHNVTLSAKEIQDAQTIGGLDKLIQSKK